jgi:hypothetical protein
VLGLEPSLSVLETGVLPLTLHPQVNKNLSKQAEPIIKCFDAFVKMLLNRRKTSYLFMPSLLVTGRMFFVCEKLQLINFFEIEGTKETLNTVTTMRAITTADFISKTSRIQLAILIPKSADFKTVLNKLLLE